MKRLPKKFIIVSPDYIEAHKYSLKLGGIITPSYCNRIWFVNETLAIYCSRKIARKKGHILAKAWKLGYIENITRGEIFTKKHRVAMILYDR